MIRFLPISGVFGGVDFWNQVAELKKSHWKLDDTPKDALYGKVDRNTRRLVVVLSLEKPKAEDSYSHVGTIWNVNSLEDFRSRDKNALIRDFAQKVRRVSFLI
jgi:hypothetical protein